MSAPASRLSGVFRDAGWIALSSLAAAGLGLVFWGVSGHLIPPYELGQQTAVLAAITTPGAIAATGVGDALNSVAGANRPYRQQLIRHAYRLTVAASLPLAILTGVIAALALPGHHGEVGLAVGVAAGGVLWALFTIQDAALTTLRRTVWLPVENILAAVGRIGLLFALQSAVFGVVWSTVVPTAVAVIVLGPLIERLSRTPGSRNEGSVVSGSTYLAVRSAFNHLAIRNLGAVALTLGALTFLPFVVTAVGGPTQGALFALAFGFASVLDYVAHGVSTALLVHTAESPEGEAELRRQALRRTLVTVAVAGAFVVGLSGPLFYLLNKQYLSQHGITVVALLAVTSLMRVVYFMWLSRQQLRQQLAPVLRLNLVTAVLMYALTLTLAEHNGALVAAAAMAAAQVILSTGAARGLRARPSYPRRRGGSETTPAAQRS